jgi:GT2 family glycosyltransferase
MSTLSRDLALREHLCDCLDEDAPIALRAVDLERLPATLTLPPSRSGEPYVRLAALAIAHGRPLGWRTLPVAPDGSVSLERFLVEPAKALNDRGPSPPQPTLSLSVVVTSCANPDSAIGCVETIRACRGAREGVEIIVVENRPALSTLQRALVDRYAEDPRVRYVEEPRRGLSCARNAGLNAARGELVAFTDEDIHVDPRWVAAIRSRFALDPEVECVSGLILPLELENRAQTLFERFASFGKGMHARTYSLREAPRDQPLFPYSAGHFVSGANIAFRASAIRALGGFDERLGAGTRARGGEDLDVCIRLINAGRALAYEPAAIVWHRHPEAADELPRQVFNYGVGLGALLTKQLVRGPRRRWMLARAPQAVRYFLDPSSRKNIARRASFPTALSRIERLGVLSGPVAYLASLLERR